jgi:hypothetical protein
MPAWTKKNFADLADRSPDETMEWRLSRGAIRSRQVGVSRFTYAPGARMPFGHRHLEQEEVYVVVGGSGLLKLDDDIHKQLGNRTRPLRRRPQIGAARTSACSGPAGAAPSDPSRQAYCPHFLRPRRGLIHR